MRDDGLLLDVSPEHVVGGEFDVADAQVISVLLEDWWSRRDVLRRAFDGSDA